MTTASPVVLHKKMSLCKNHMITLIYSHSKSRKSEYPGSIPSYFPAQVFSLHPSSPTLSTGCFSLDWRETPGKYGVLTMVFPSESRGCPVNGPWKTKSMTISEWEIGSRLETCEPPGSHIFELVRHGSPFLGDPLGGFHKWGIPKWLVYNGKSH